MRNRSKLLFGLVFISALAAALLWAFWPEDEVVFGLAVARCPGPDEFGYTCASADGYAYIDASNDTLLYADDGFVTVDLPFPFAFYGTTYNTVHLSSNGTLHFGNGRAEYANVCLDERPAPGMGDMIAPFWDDLDLTMAGYLETEVVGVAPQRIFVVEWDDVPRYGVGGDNQVTFAVQLFEGSHDIVFLYEDVTTLTESNGRSATIGLQSEAAGRALQLSCNQAAVQDGGGVHFPYPLRPNPDTGQAAAPRQAAAPATLQAKGETAVLLQTITRQGPTALDALQRHWLNQQPPRLSEWVWADVTGNGREELILVWRGTTPQPELGQLIVLTTAADGQMHILLSHHFGQRDEASGHPTIFTTADLTGDQQPDVLLQDLAGQRQFVLTSAPGELSLLPLPETCAGSLRVVASSGPVPHIVRANCATPGRLTVTWDGDAFTPLP